ncbi:MAG TPA: hypothetical protein VG713_08030, partial [Pirellulales bacterium]|nr:hypothetical protein [Pirellulales bacterium]
RQIPAKYPTITQDFGYSPTNFAGLARGEMGGTVRRAYEPAFYAARIPPRTLDETLHASGNFCVTKTLAGGGLFFGFFRAEQPGGGGRPISSLGMNLDCETKGCRLAVRLITGHNQSCGTFVTPYLPGKFRPTPLKNDGTRYHWTLDYDPAGAGGNGQFRFTLSSEKHSAQDYGELNEAARDEAQRRFPNTHEFIVDLPEGYKQQDTVFDHFGLMNMMKFGGSMTIYFDDLRYDGQAQDFADDPKWDSAGNRRTYTASDVGGAQNFGYSATNHAGGQPGEIGGVFWRSESKWGYYADRVGRLSMNDRLEARGKIKLVAGGPDADMCFGWFRTDGSDTPPNRAGDFLGVKIGGPTRVGHMLAPSFFISEQVRGLADQSPTLVPGKAYDWSLVYDPAGADGLGTITATLGDASVTLTLRPGQRAQAKDAFFDHFGMFSIYPGGQIVHVYLDDLQYTAATQ